MKLGTYAMRFACCLSLIMFCMCNFSQAGVVISNNKNDYMDVLPPGSQITNDSFASSKSQAEKLIFDSGVVSIATGESRHVIRKGLFSTLVINSDTQYSEIQWTFLPKTVGFAFDFFGALEPDPNESVQISIFDGGMVETFLMYDLLGGAGQPEVDGFIGFLGMNEISAISFSGAGTGAASTSANFFEIDNLTFAQVPLPASYPLLLSGLAALGALGRAISRSATRKPRSGVPERCTVRE